MKITAKKVLLAAALYEVGAYAFNSYQVSKPSAAGAAVFTLPFDLLSNLLGYPNPSNPTVPAGTVSGLGAMMPRTMVRGPIFRQPMPVRRVPTPRFFHGVIKLDGLGAYMGGRPLIRG